MAVGLSFLSNLKCVHTMLILGIDTSLRSSGVAVVQTQGSVRIPLYYGTIKNAPKVSLSEALCTIREAIIAIIDKWHPEAVAIEGVFYYKNARTMMILCHARGVVVEVCAECGLPVYEYAPTDVKQAITGSGRAEKAQIQTMVSRMLNLTELPQNDAADALALALTHINRTGGYCTINKAVPL